ncbi:MAG TPA: transketolase [Candidatus Methylomirabilis sp.]|nr:transketolase [Candidatus Methylomirabilis sp.]
MPTDETGGHVSLPWMTTTVRRWIVEQSLRSNVGHVASALSIVDIMVALWASVMRDPGTSVATRDRFILAKGHASLALYSVLRLMNRLDEPTFRTYCADGSLLGVHPEARLPGVDLSTGSLGQGLSVACGLAYGLRCRRQPSRVFVLMSDGECNEGQVWEAVQFAAHHRLENLTAVIDLNGVQALGFTRDILDSSPMAEKWRAFGWEAVEVDGHDLKELVPACATSGRGRPKVVVARTVQGKGVSFMEGKLEWHYRNLTPELAAQALAELQAPCETR